MAKTKYIFMMILSTGLLISACNAKETGKLSEQKDKESYSLGYRFGESLKFQKVDINLDSYLAGFHDAMAGKERRMSDEEIKSAISGLLARVTADQQKSKREQAEKNLAEGKSFLEENGKKEGITTLPSGLQYKVLSEGSGKTPQKNDTVMVRYCGTFINGEEFDKVCDTCEPQAIQIGQVIPGWTEALQLMKEGAKWRIFIPSELAYGEQGAPPRIMPNSTLIFEVDLVSINQSENSQQTAGK